MPMIQIEKYEFRSEDVAYTKDDGNWRQVYLRGNSDPLYLSAPIEKIRKMIREADLAAQEKRENELKLLAGEIATNIVDMTRQYDEEREARQQAKPKKPLSLG